MQIELILDGETKIFTTPFVPMLAKRKYLEIEAEKEARKNPLTLKEQLVEEDEYLSILSDVVFNGQFTVQDLYKGASKEYVNEKLLEAIFGIKPSEAEKNSEGNNEGK